MEQLESPPESALPFGADEYERRLQALIHLMHDSELDGVVLAEPPSIYYYTGYNTLGFWNFQLLVVSENGERCIVCFFEEVPSAERAGCLAEGYAFGADPVSAIEKAFRRLGLSAAKAVGVEAGSRYLPLAIADEIRKRLSATLRNVGSTISDLRLVKSESEVDYIQQAATLSSRAMEAGLSTLRKDVLDTDVAIAMHTSAIGSGSEYFSIPPIVKFGGIMTEGHLTWRGQRLGEHEAVNLEIAAVRHRYHAPLLRCAIESNPDTETSEAMEVALRGLQATLDAIRPGVTGGEVDKASVAAVDDAPFIYQPAGYSVGIGYPPSWMEANLLAEGNRTPLRTGMTLHVVPCVLLPGKAHLGASETVLVTNDGVEILTQLPRELRVL